MKKSKHSLTLLNTCKRGFRKKKKFEYFLKMELYCVIHKRFVINTNTTPLRVECREVVWERVRKNRGMKDEETRRQKDAPQHRRSRRKK